MICWVSDFQAGTAHHNSGFASGNQKGTQTLAHKTLSGRRSHRSSRPGTRAKRFMLLWVAKIVHKHVALGGRLPGHRKGSPAKVIYVYVPFAFPSFVERD